MFQSLNDEKLDASEKKDRLTEIGWIVGGLVTVGGVVWFLVSHTIHG
jgi:hypothetical protein